MDDNKKALKGSVFDWGWDAESVGKVYLFVMCDVLCVPFMNLRYDIIIQEG